MIKNYTVAACKDCDGSGCDTCHGIGKVVIWKPQPSCMEYKPNEWVPLPYGKILPDLTDAYYVNEDWTPDSYLDQILCPNCGSNHIAGLDKEHNSEVYAENISACGRWFCISCQDSWCYGREH